MELVSNINLKMVSTTCYCRPIALKVLHVTLRQHSKLKRKHSVTIVYRSVILPPFLSNWISRHLTSSHYI